MAQAKKVFLVCLTVFVMYTIINDPERSGELVKMGFQGISSAAGSVGDFMTELVN